MVSLRRRRLLGLCSGNSSFVTPLPLHCEDIPSSKRSLQHDKPTTEHPMPLDDTRILDRNMKEETVSSNGSAYSSPTELPGQQVTGPPIKRRKQHRRKPLHNQEPCLMRGVYFKNMKWQAAIKVDKKQIHLGTVGSQEEAARLYDRAAFMCGREPNFELSEEEKQELSKFKWDEFLAMTRHAITSKKHKRRLGAPRHRSQKGDSDSKQGDSEDAGQETASLF